MLSIFLRKFFWDSVMWLLECVTKVVEGFFCGNYLEVVLQPDQEWKGYSLQDALFIQRMFHLLQFHHLKMTPGKRDVISFALHRSGH